MPTVISTCSAAALKANNPLLFDDKLSLAQLQATIALALAYTVKGLGGVDYTNVAVLQPAVSDYFSHNDNYLAQAEATLAIAEIPAAPGSGAVFKSLATLLPAVNPITTQMTAKELRAAAILLRCNIIALTGY
jgi:hypothetical protein